MRIDVRAGVLAALFLAAFLGGPTRAADYDSLEEFERLPKGFWSAVYAIVRDMNEARYACDSIRMLELDKEMFELRADYLELLQRVRPTGPRAAEIEEARNAALADLAVTRIETPQLGPCRPPDPLEDILSEIEYVDPTLPGAPRPEAPAPAPDAPAAAPAPQPLGACPRPGRAPIEVGPNGAVGSGARLKSKAASTALGIVGGLIGAGGGGGGRGGPPLVRCRIKDSEMTLFSDPESGIALRIGAKPSGDAVTVYAEVAKSPDSGTFQTSFVESAAGELMAPADVGICDLWGEWSLTVSWTRSTYVDGQLVERESGGWGRSGIFSIPGMVSDASSPDGLWRRLGFSNASHGARKVALLYPLPKGALAQGPLELLVHVTRPGQDPVTTVPFAMRMVPSAAGIAFERAPDDCEATHPAGTVDGGSAVTTAALPDPPAVVAAPAPQAPPPDVPEPADPGEPQSAGATDPPCIDPCDEVRRRLARTRAERDAHHRDLEARTQECEALQAGLDDAERALRAAEDELRAARRPPEEGASWIEDAATRERLTSRDVQLRREASRAAWERYKAGEITAQELEAEWRRLGEREALERLRREDAEARRAAAEEAVAGARAARDEARARHDAKEAEKARLRDAIARLDADIEALLKELADCNARRCEQPAPTASAAPAPPPPGGQDGGAPEDEEPGGVPEGGQPGGTPPADPSSRPEPEDPCYCGPEMSAAVAEGLNRLRQRIESLPANEIGLYDGVGFLFRNAGSFDAVPSPTRIPGAGGDGGAGESWLCPSPKCRVFETRMSAQLCGYCLPFHMFNEINAAFVASGVSVPLPVFVVGANVRELHDNGAIEGAAPMTAYLVGYDLQDLARLSAFFDADRVCEVVQKRMETRWPLVLAEYPHLKDCTACPDPTPGRYGRDFTRSLWTLTDGTRVGQEYTAQEPQDPRASQPPQPDDVTLDGR